MQPKYMNTLIYTKREYSLCNRKVSDPPLRPPKSAKANS